MSRNPETYSFSLSNRERAPAGSFVLDLESGLAEWSDGLFAIHGYHRGEVVPTVDMILAHKHPEDREPIRGLIRQLCSSGGQGAFFHRLLDSRGRERLVLTVAEARGDGPGRITSIHGLTVDLTGTVAAETGPAAAAAVSGAYASRTLIEQAKGIIMGRLEVGAEEAFGVLARISHHTNTKLSAVASELVEAADQGTVTEALHRWRVSGR